MENKNHTAIWIAIFLLFVLVYILLGYEGYHTTEIRKLQTQTQYPLIELFPDWDVECVEEVVIEKFELITSSRTDYCDDICWDVEECREHFNGSPDCRYLTSCLELCSFFYPSNSTESHLEFWNETICVKELLVRRLGNG